MPGRSKLRGSPTVNNHVSLLWPSAFRSAPERIRLRSGGIEIILVRVFAFSVMAAVALGLYAEGADLASASGVVVALGVAAMQMTGTTETAPARGITPTPAAG